MAARLSPVPADAISYGAGLSGVPLGAYVLGTALGELPWALAFVTIGDSLTTLSVEGLQPSPRLLAGTTLLAVLLLLVPASRRLRELLRAG